MDEDRRPLGLIGRLGAGLLATLFIGVAIASFVNPQLGYQGWDVIFLVMGLPFLYFAVGGKVRRGPDFLSDFRHSFSRDPFIIVIRKSIETLRWRFRRRR